MNNHFDFEKKSLQKLTMTLSCLYDSCEARRQEYCWSLARFLIPFSGSDTSGFNFGKVEEFYDLSYRDDRFRSHSPWLNDDTPKLSPKSKVLQHIRTLERRICERIYHLHHLSQACCATSSRRIWPIEGGDIFHFEVSIVRHHCHHFYIPIPSPNSILSLTVFECH